MEQEIIQLGLLSSAVAILYIIYRIISVIFGKKNNKNGLGLINLKLDNHITTIGKEIIEMKEDIREIKTAILDIKIKMK